MRRRRKRAGAVLVACSLALAVLGVVLLVLGSNSAGVVAVLVGMVGLTVYALITRKNRAREAAVE